MSKSHRARRNNKRKSNQRAKNKRKAIIQKPHNENGYIETLKEYLPLIFDIGLKIWEFLSNQ